MQDFKVELLQKDNVQVVKIAGILDAHTTGELEKYFDKLVYEKKYHVLVNLTELNYISSAGLGVFMAYVETMRENNGDIKFAELQDKVFHVFDLLGFPMLYEFYKKEDEALKKFIEG